MQQLDHEKLDVYKATVEFVTLTNLIIKKVPKGNSHINDQLRRASSSVLLNIAEGAGEFAINEKIRFYRMARRSATECAAIIDLCYHLTFIEDTNHLKSRELLIRIISMLTKMVRQ